ncbi:hypothetical protein HK097_002251 [Rhizophlyctis rosea]|uniref:Uncharacterized protein n=1 Tax=Rhizophlyctis rosea TaxID=64517 RepID=A0AAD5SFL0_9FUNG|nr:hypothetical protein HK097_002251 [Rhizophlyctis rosea]
MPGVTIASSAPPALPNKAKQKVPKQAELKQLHDGNCICSVCECGRHKLCQPIRKTEGKLDGHTG